MSVFKRWKGKRITTAHPKYKEAKWTCEFYLDGKTYKKSIPGARTMREAEDFERNWRQSIKGGISNYFIDETNFKDFVESVYLPYVANNNPSASKKFEIGTLNRFFGDYRLKAITPGLIEQFKAKRSKERVYCQKCRFGKKHDCERRLISPATVNRELSALSKILSLAVRNEKFADNPKRFVPQLQEPDPRERFLTKDEKKNFLPNCKSRETSSFRRSSRSPF